MPTIKTQAYIFNLNKNFFMKKIILIFSSDTSLNNGYKEVFHSKIKFFSF
ncbi:hypothetical protein DEU39_4710 [Chryseobacterium sp. AG363]|nr:hypothetical protein DEU39_4710 [Chryseobacterium sp. AG363]